METISPGQSSHSLFVYLDFCFYAYCNFTCSYCRESNDQMSQGQGRDAFDRAVADFLQQNSAAVFKVSGYGEATLWPELPKAVQCWASHFPTVQLISNGAGPRHVIEELCQLPNFQPCITLDGHTLEMNRFRTKGNQSLHRRTIETVSCLVAAGKSVELNCVITQANASKIRDYLSWAGDVWGSGVRIIPFPVRPTLGRSMEEIIDHFVATPDQIETLENVIVRDHSDFATLLPPKSYTRCLIEFLRHPYRKRRCHIHRANFGVNTKSEALACACAGDRFIRPLGAITSVGTDPEVERRRHSYLVDGNVGAKCVTCFTHYDIVNLYFEGLISDEEIVGVPSLSAALAYLKAIKLEIQPYL